MQWRSSHRDVMTPYSSRRLPAVAHGGDPSDGSSPSAQAAGRAAASRQATGTKGGAQVCDVVRVAGVPGDEGSSVLLGWIVTAQTGPQGR
jgi:hypothetical protein